MRSKAPLALMEQMVMLLVFALASALCLQAFVKSDSISLKNGNRSRAALEAQNVAEAIQHSGGDLEHALAGAGELLKVEPTDGKLQIFYDEDWNMTGEGLAYYLEAEGVPTDTPGLLKAAVQVFANDESLKGDAKPEVLFAIEVAWLEEDSNG